MKKITLFGLIILALTLLMAGAVSAEDKPYDFTVICCAAASERTDNWSLDLNAPEVQGLADEAAAKALNDAFLDTLHEMQDAYDADVADAKANAAEGAGPHFSYEYTYEKVTNNEDYMSLRTSQFYAAGSSMTVNKYFTFSKQTGKEIQFSEVVSEEAMSGIRDQILAEMTEANASDGAMYWIEDDSLDTAMENIVELRHWYINGKNELVFTFDKYEIAPGAQGSSEFIIDPEFYTLPQ